MSKVETREDLIKYIGAMLGAPAVCIELSNEQINYIIDDVIEYFIDNVIGAEDEEELIKSVEFRRACVAYCGELWARILGKYKLQITDNGEINAEFLHRVFQEKINELEHKHD